MCDPVRPRVRGWWPCQHPFEVVGWPRSKEDHQTCAYLDENRTWMLMRIRLESGLSHGNETRKGSSKAATLSRITTTNTVASCCWCCQHPFEVVGWPCGKEDHQTMTGTPLSLLRWDVHIWSASNLSGWESDFDWRWHCNLMGWPHDDVADLAMTLGWPHDDVADLAMTLATSCAPRAFVFCLRSFCHNYIITQWPWKCYSHHSNEMRPEAKQNVKWKCRVMTDNTYIRNKISIFFYSYS